MNFGLDLTPQLSNQLDNYIRRSNSQQLIDSLRNANNSIQLQAYFHQLKEQHSKRMSDLQKRLDNCLQFHKQTQISLDDSRSRIKEERHNLSVERYEDLMQFNFKEIQWTKTSRISTPEDNQQNNSLERIEQLAQTLEEQLSQSEQNQEILLLKIEEQANQELSLLQQKLHNQQQETSTNLQRLQQTISNLETNFKQETETLSNHLTDTNNKITNMLATQIERLQTEVKQLTHQPNN